MKYTMCDHVCKIHPKVEYEIIGGILPPEQAYKKMSPEARAIVDRMRKSTGKIIKEIHEKRDATKSK